MDPGDQIRMGVSGFPRKSSQESFSEEVTFELRPDRWGEADVKTLAWPVQLEGVTGLGMDQ